MKAVLQRVSRASVTVNGEVTGEIGPGLLVLFGVGQGDTEKDSDFLARKTVALRIFNDQDDKMNLSLADVGGELLVVSQFTLLADARKGLRPSYSQSAPPEEAERLYKDFVRRTSEYLGKPVQTGRFGAMMEVSLVNDGPVTILLESPNP